MQYILGLDLGTTGNRAILFDAEGAIAGQAYKELRQYYPQPGYLEHDPEEIWQDTYTCIQQILKHTGISANAIAAIGLSVQRETCLLWDKTTGKPLHKAIVWQDRRTASMCRQLQAKGQAKTIQERTGLIVDAYFSATKFAWLLDWVRDKNININLDNILAGTIDTWILWKLTGGKVHATDHSNASRTMLMNLAQGNWDSQLLDLFQIPDRIMPQIQPSLGMFGETDPQLLGEAIPIAAVFGDQQAALFAHGCDRPGMVKCTYGTGCFLIAHTGEELTRSHHQLLSTVAWTQVLANGRTATSYALEAAMFTTGACIQWLRDGLKLIDSAAETEHLARQVTDNNGVYFVPALSGLGAPRWDMSARGAFLGITGGVQREHMVRAVLEAIAYQVKEAIEAMNRDSSKAIEVLKVDGGACQNDFLMQFQADALGIPIERPVVLEATAQGAAFGAGLAIGYWTDYQKLCRSRKIDRIFEPGTGAIQAQENFHTWLKAVNRAQHWVDESHL
ncbi:MAG: Glycerol kinase [Chroococcidiopsis cubana SAG 39.79]|uniref:Glycerol kinase n=2 Tax=Chroococcidiopsis TaxID=54298 RepID=K9TUC0_CHRTP|nr:MULTISPECIES: glycerol kinase GlpK [Chroococcidiopsis]AFY86427.1 glycerol kinase [Chroococcidiopsis thermalis PCC 7203]MDZ4873683.1 Glycerol kinase [Chroococcidiopsis cubana SAG 39.79]PSB61163.1 glycerol kinase [Chroococcidiopsis cubana CCALA 043]RUT03715.1 glycerol kinase [Chroococcidiopsis cubana SAG 39.79]